jgi:hypothetical protein
MKFERRMSPLFNVDEPPAGGTPTPNTQATPPTASTTDPTPTGAANQPEKKLELTQDQLDAIINDRLSREKKKYSDYDDMKKKVTDFEKQQDELRKSQLSEIELAKEEAKKLAEEKATYEKQLAELKSQNKKQSVINEFIKIANQRNVQFVDDAIVLAQNDLSMVEVDESGKAIGVDSIVDKLVQSKPYLVAQATAQPKIIGQSSNPDPNDEVKSIEVQLEDAKRKKDFNKVITLSNKLKNLLKG